MRLRLHISSSLWQQNQTIYLQLVSNVRLKLWTENSLKSNQFIFEKQTLQASIDECFKSSKLITDNIPLLRNYAHKRVQILARSLLTSRRFWFWFCAIFCWFWRDNMCFQFCRFQCAFRSDSLLSQWNYSATTCTMSAEPKLCQSSLRFNAFGLCQSWWHSCRKFLTKQFGVSEKLS